MLELSNVRVRYQRVEAVKGISMRVDEGQIVTILGANGAGKTTTLRAISGLLPTAEGEIRFLGKRINSAEPRSIVGAGIAHVPEGRRVFPNMTVAENLGLGAFLRNDHDGIRKDTEELFEHFPRLKERQKQRAGTLSGGEQQMLAIARALMAKPKLLMLDEPSLGLSPLMVQEVARIIVDINQRGISVVLVEQNALLALKLAHWAYVLQTGAVALDGKASDLITDPEVKKAYLGG